MEREVLLSGKTSFRFEVPYTLLETGGAGEKPLIVYLHGYNQNIELFQKKLEELLSLEAYHLFIEGPYPVPPSNPRSKPVREWGRSWYLYDGEQPQFIRSLELSSEFVQEVIDSLLNQIRVNRLALVGYSMGGYLAGYFALSRWKHVNDLVVVAGRIKTEAFRERKGSYDHMQVLALHGSGDESVKAEPQRKSSDELSGWGARVTYREVEEGHRLSRAYVAEIMEWFKSAGYSSA